MIDNKNEEAPKLPKLGKVVKDFLFMFITCFQIVYLAYLIIKFKNEKDFSDVMFPLLIIISSLVAWFIFLVVDYRKRNKKIKQ